jgi:hypothetical protein
LITCSFFMYSNKIQHIGAKSLSSMMWKCNQHLI